MTEMTEAEVEVRGSDAARSARVGMIGAGQLSRMTHQAAIGIGVELVVLAADPGDSAALVDPHVRIGVPDDLEALRSLARECDVVTFDHEGVPSEHIEALEAEGFAVRPGSEAKLVAQDKLHARERLSELGFPVPEFVTVASESDARAFGERTGWPLVLKARRGGYDGRGVMIVGEGELASAMEDLRGEWIAERRVAIERELAQITVRSPGGELVQYPLTETVQRDGICVETHTPAPVDEDLAARCGELTRGIAEAIGAVGLVAVELFLDEDGEITVNELALRPHNSGHFTIEACETSQFENHLRAVLDWPLGSTAMRAPAATMRNVIGVDDAGPASRLPEALAVEGAHPHLYGKEPRPGRKLGHVTALGASPEQAADRARRCAAELDRVEVRA